MPDFLRFFPRDMFIFGTLIFFAFRTRSNPAAHKRLILIATITLLAAAMEPLSPLPIIRREPVLIDLIDDAFLLPLVAYDLRVAAQGASSNAVGRTILGDHAPIPRAADGSTAARQSFATWVLERIKVFH